MIKFLYFLLIFVALQKGALTGPEDFKDVIKDKGYYTLSNPFVSIKCETPPTYYENAVQFRNKFFNTSSGTWEYKNEDFGRFVFLIYPFHSKSNDHESDKSAIKSIGYAKIHHFVGRSIIKIEDFFINGEERCRGYARETLETIVSFFRNNITIQLNEYTKLSLSLEDQFHCLTVPLKTLGFEVIKSTKGQGDDDHYYRSEDHTTHYVMEVDLSKFRSKGYQN